MNREVLVEASERFNWQPAARKRGWYAVLRVFDELDEGVADVAYWDGLKWTSKQNGVVRACEGPYYKYKRALSAAKLLEVPSFDARVTERRYYDMDRFSCGVRRYG